MKIDKSVLVINGILFGVSILFMISTGVSGAGLGLAALLIAVINLFLILIFSISGNRNAMLTSLIFAGVLFTIGFSVCSNSRMDFR
jgi:hypothetical protein